MLKTEFSTLAYAKLNLDFDHDLFAKEYDEKLLPHSNPITNAAFLIKLLYNLNIKWNMVPPELYGTGDVWTQPGDITTTQYHKRDRPGWLMTQLVAADPSTLDHPILIKAAKNGGVPFRNETLDKKYKFSIRPQYADLKIWQWIENNLPFEKIIDVRAVSLETRGFAAIHRDSKGLFSNTSSAGSNNLFKNGFVVINLNITNGGAPLYWSLDKEGINHPSKVDDSVYLTNDYFLHGVPILTSRRRQIRITGIPKPELWDLIDHSTKIDIGDDYQYDPSYSVEQYLVN
jgi:hypothetical protein